MINDPLPREDGFAEPTTSIRLKLLAIVCAVGVSAILLVGYGYVRKRYAQQVVAANTLPTLVDNGPKGPPVVHILVDDPLLDKGSTIIGGTVKNISKRELTGLTIALELMRRKDGVAEQASVLVEPARLQPEGEGVYTLKLSSQRYGSIRLIGPRADPQSTLVAYSSSAGKKRAPERLEPRTVIVNRSSRKGDFLNTPDNPTRVP
jgi:hypothetical protein